MGRPRDEIARRRESAFFRATGGGWEKIRISGRNQHDGITSPNGASAIGRGHWSYRTGNSTHPESETADRFKLGLQFTQARNSSAEYEFETGPRSAVTGNYP